MYIFIIVTSMFTLFQWSVTPFLDRTERLLPFNIWIPINVKVSPNYELVYIYQVISIVTSAEIALAIDAVTIGLFMFICAQLDIIMVDIQKIQKISSSLSSKDKRKLIRQNNRSLAGLIGHHQAIIRFLEQVKDLFHINIFHQMCGVIVVFCIILFRISVEPPNTMQFYSSLNYLAVMLSQLFVYCWCGNELTARSEDLRDVLYTCPWYEQDLKFRKTLFITMECMKRPLIFTAGYFITLSRPTFVSILRCSYSYFAVLNQANEDD